MIRERLPISCSDDALSGRGGAGLDGAALASKLSQAFADTGIAISLVAEIDTHVVGFALARVHYGEFGVMEPAAVLDVIGVAPDFRGPHVAAALVESAPHEPPRPGNWPAPDRSPLGQPGLAGLFHRERFVIAQRVCLDLDLVRTRD